VLACSNVIAILCTSDDVVGDEDDDDDEDDSWIREEEEEFRTELDQNQDGVLDSEEMNRWLVPDDMENIVEETVHLFSEADLDKVDI